MFLFVWLILFVWRCVMVDKIMMFDDVLSDSIDSVSCFKEGFE